MKNLKENSAVYKLAELSLRAVPAATVKDIIYASHTEGEFSRTQILLALGVFSDEEIASSINDERHHIVDNVEFIQKEDPKLLVSLMNLCADNLEVMSEIGTVVEQSKNVQLMKHYLSSIKNIEIEDNFEYKDLALASKTAISAKSVDDTADFTSKMTYAYFDIIGTRPLYDVSKYREIGAYKFLLSTQDSVFLEDIKDNLIAQSKVRELKIAQMQEMRKVLTEKLGEFADLGYAMIESLGHHTMELPAQLLKNLNVELCDEIISFAPHFFNSVTKHHMASCCNTLEDIEGHLEKAHIVAVDVDYLKDTITGREIQHLIDYQDIFKKTGSTKKLLESDKNFINISVKIDKKHYNLSKPELDFLLEASLGSDPVIGAGMDAEKLVKIIPSIYKSACDNKKSKELEAAELDKYIVSISMEVNVPAARVLKV